MIFFTLNDGDLIQRFVARDICYARLLVWKCFKVHDHV